MNTLPYSLVVLLLGSAGLLALPPAALPPATQTGSVLLLDTEQLVEGNIEKIGKNYRIRGAMSETILSGDRVLALVQSRKEAFAVLQQYANLRDPDERLRLARWCVLQGLREEAVVEAQAILKIDPRNTDAEIILAGLRETKPVRDQSPRPMTPAAQRPQPVIEVTPADFNRESFGLFVTKVQPILMNTCIGCHSNGKGGGFQLLRLAMPGDRKANLHNLATALKFLDRDRAATSPLLRKSITAHGEAIEPPLKDQKILAYENLEAWVSLALAPDGSTEGIPLTGEVKEVKPAVERKWEPKASTAGPKKTGPIFGEESSSKPLPEIKTAPSDPFDPAIFNGEIKPKK